EPDEVAPGKAQLLGVRVVELHPRHRATQLVELHRIGPGAAIAPAPGRADLPEEHQEVAPTPGAGELLLTAGCAERILRGHPTGRAAEADLQGRRLGGVIAGDAGARLEHRPRLGPGALPAALRGEGLALQLPRLLPGLFRFG